MRTRIPTLDGYRAIAILAVITHHAVLGLFSREEGAIAFPWIWSFARGVDLFFSISGFLITTLLVEEWKATGAISLKGFYIRRVFRIFPPFLVIIAVLSVLRLWRSPIEMASCLLFFRNYMPERLTTWYSAHFWSLSVEEHFYLLWPAILLSTGPRRAKTIALVLALAVGIWRATESQFALTIIPGVDPVLRTDFRLDELLWGCLFAITLAEAKEWERFRRQMNPLGWTIAAAGVLATCYLYSPLTSSLLSVLLAMMVGGTVTHPEWGVSRILESAPLRLFGRMSYSLYLWQQLFFVPGWKQHGHPWWQHFPANFVITMAAAFASYHLVERPMMSWGRRIAARRATALAIAPQINPQLAESR